jgi:curved DNA-binding protein CbpA
VFRDDYYTILGVPRYASVQDIKRAYHKLVLLYHPDLNPDHPNAEDRLKIVIEAYHTLSDSSSRTHYDTFLTPVFAGNQYSAARSLMKERKLMATKGLFVIAIMAVAILKIGLMCLSDQLQICDGYRHQIITNSTHPSILNSQITYDPSLNLRYITPNTATSGVYHPLVPVSSNNNRSPSIFIYGSHAIWTHLPPAGTSPCLLRVQSATKN